MNLLFPVILAVTSLLSWWLSGYDSKLTGDDKAADFKRRIIRCAITVFLMALGVSATLGGGRFGGIVYIALVLPLALIWVGCLSELFARGFHSLIDSPGGAGSDPRKISADLDRVAALFEQGRNEEAIALCTKLFESGDASGLAMETMLFKLYDAAFGDERLGLYPALAEAGRMCAAGHFSGAESQLNLLLKREPRNLACVLTLSRLYAQNLGRPDRSYALIQDFERRPGVPPFFVEYARRRVGEWLDPKAKEEKSTEGIESLLVDGKHRKSNQGQGNPGTD